MAFRRVSLLLAAAFSLVLFVPSAFAAEDPGTVQERLEDVQKKIEGNEAQLKSARKLERVTLKELEAADRKLVRVSKQLSVYRAKLKKTQSRTVVLEGEMAFLEARIEDRKHWLVRKLRAMNRHSRSGDMLLVLSGSSDLGQLVRRWHYLGVLARHDKDVMEAYRADLTERAQKRKELAAVTGELKEQEHKVLLAEKALLGEKKKKEALLARVRSKKGSYERMLKELRRSSARLQKMLKQYKQATRYRGTSIRKLKGRLPWPVHGPVAVPYGVQEDPRFKTPVFRNGIYIAAPPGALARAVHGGDVVYADWFRGYGQVVIINHGGGYHSLYGNLSEIFLKQGDIIGKDDVIGRVGTSGMLSRPSLYFEIRYNGKPLNPTQWLSKNRR
ncbi:MAG: peptidoglycan DD-metalloendopeptidase family protein [Nitrospirota bacterium]